MWAFIVRKILYNIPVYLAIVALLMVLLRLNDPIYAYLGKNATEEQAQRLRVNMGLDDPFVVQYGRLLTRTLTLDFRQESWKQEGRSVKDIMVRSIPKSLSITLPEVALAAIVAIFIALVSAYFRGRPIDRVLVIIAVLGMSISYLVYVVFGQFFFAYLPKAAGWGFTPFQIEGYKPWIPPEGSIANWVAHCMLPVMIGAVVAVGYDTRFYRAVMVEESGRDYIVTAMAKGASKPKIMFVHMLKNAMIPIITRIMSSLPFLIIGSVLLEWYFNIPGMGRELITAIINKDFPVVEAFVSVFAAIFIATVILTDVLYALVDPRVRLS